MVLILNFMESLKMTARIKIIQTLTANILVAENNVLIFIVYFFIMNK